MQSDNVFPADTWRTCTTVVSCPYYTHVRSLDTCIDFSVVLFIFSKCAIPARQSIIIKFGVINSFLMSPMLPSLSLIVLSISSISAFNSPNIGFEFSTELRSVFFIGPTSLSNCSSHHGTRLWHDDTTAFLVQSKNLFMIITKRVFLWWSWSSTKTLEAFGIDEKRSGLSGIGSLGTDHLLSFRFLSTSKYTSLLNYTERRMYLWFWFLSQFCSQWDGQMDQQNLA